MQIAKNQLKQIQVCRKEIARLEKMISKDKASLQDLKSKQGKPTVTREREKKRLMQSLRDQIVRSISTAELAKLPPVAKIEAYATVWTVWTASDIAVLAGSTELIRERAAGPGAWHVAMARVPASVYEDRAATATPSL